jgi:hypothetical protein
MKKLIFFIISLTSLSCQKYDEISNPQLNLNGRWDVVKVKVLIDKVNFSSHVTVLSESEASVGNFYVKQILKDGTLLLSQDFKGTPIDKRFSVDKTTWDFQYNQLRIYEDNQNITNNDYIFVDFPCTYCTKKTIMEWNYLGGETRYTFLYDTYGAMPSNELILTSQSFYTDIKLGSNTYDKAIESHLEITLHKK